jgi:hypothetical protein
MAESTTSKPTRAELRRQQTLERRKQNVAEVLGEASSEILPVRRALSFTAATLQRALPAEVIQRGLITFDQAGQPRVASYDPSLLATNPQRGRMVDRHIDTLADSLNTFGQQEMIVARLITDTDRKRWPDAFNDRQILLILKGHRIYFAQPKTKLKTLRVELMLPQEGETDLTYSRRALLRASIKMMHSQGYDIFDKVNQLQIWKEEFALEKPKDADVAQYFEISRTEAQRLKVVAELDDTVAQDIINSDKRPADEVVFAIANRPIEEHRKAYDEFGHLTVAAVRKLLKDEESRDTVAKVTGSGRPRNYVLPIRDEESNITYVSTALTPQQWKRRGGAKAFWESVRKLAHSREIQDRIKSDLG